MAGVVTQEVMDILKSHAKPALKELVDLALDKIQEKVAASPTPIDDALYAAAKAPLKAQLIEMIEKL